MSPLPQERLWLHVDTIRVFGLSPIRVIEENEAVAHYAVDLGAFRFHGADIRLDKESGELSRSWAQMTARFHQKPLDYQALDVPEKDRPPFLQNILMDAVARQCDDYFRAYLEGKMDRVDLPPWSPPSWGGKPLAIPVDYLRVSHLAAGRERGHVHGTIQVGEHFTLWEVALFDGEGFSMNDPRTIGGNGSTVSTLARITEESPLSYALFDLWKMVPAFRGLVQHLSAVGRGDTERSYTFAVPDKGPSEEWKVPEPICFWDGTSYTPCTHSIFS